jgi:hypothetical protein
MIQRLTVSLGPREIGRAGSLVRCTGGQVEDIAFLGLKVRLAKMLRCLHEHSDPGHAHEPKTTQHEISQMVTVCCESTKRLDKWNRQKRARLERGV